MFYKNFIKGGLIKIADKNPKKMKKKKREVAKVSEESSMVSESNKKEK